MTNQLAVQTQASMSIPEMANAISASGLFGKMNQAQVMGLMLISEAEGIHPAQAMREYHIIQGRPTLKAEAMLAKYQQAGGVVEWEEYTAQKVSGYFYHPKVSPKKILISWTIEDAKRAGLNSKTWQQYPKAMLRSRVISEGVRTVYPAVILGLYTPEETESFTPSPEVDIVDVTPQKPQGISPQQLNKWLAKHELSSEQQAIDILNDCGGFAGWPPTSEKEQWVTINHCISEWKAQQAPTVDTSTGEVLGENDIIDI